MKSKTSLFNRTLFLDMFKRFWPIFLAYLLVWVIVLPVSLSNSIRWNMESGANIAREASHFVLATAQIGGILMSFFFGMLMSMAAFGYLYNARSVSMMCSLPIKREGVFLSNFAAVAVGMIGINVLIFLSAMAVESYFGVLSISYLLQWLAEVSLVNLFFLGFGALCASFTGHLAVMPVLYIILNFTAMVVEFLAKQVYQVFVYGVSLGSDIKLLPLTPVIKLFEALECRENTMEMADGTQVVLNHYVSSWTWLIIYAAVGLAFALCAMLLIKHRRMETAADVVAVKPLRPVFKYCMTLGCALVLGTALYVLSFSGSVFYGGGLRQMLGMLAFMLLGAAIGYFSAEMLMQKTFRVFSGHNWVGLGVSAAFICALMLGCEYDVFGYERHLPEPSQVQGVSISCSGEYTLLEQPENIEKAIALHRDLIGHKDIYEAGNINDGSMTLNLLYTLKNDKVVQREYKIYFKLTDDLKTVNSLLNLDEAVKRRTIPSIAVEPNSVANASISFYNTDIMQFEVVQITPSQAAELYTTCIIPDAENSVLGQVWILKEGDYYNKISGTSLSMRLMRRVKESYIYSDLNLVISMDARRTNEWLFDNLGIKSMSIKEIDGLNGDHSYSEKYAEAPETALPQAS